MTHLIDKATLVGELKKLKEENKPNSKSISEYVKGGIYGFDLAIEKTLSILNTLEMKEVDLDYIKKELDELIRLNKPNGDFGWGTLYNVAKHFFELGLLVSNESQKEK